MRRGRALGALVAGGVLALGALVAPASASAPDAGAQLDRWVASVRAHGPEADDTVESPLRRWSRADPRGDTWRGRAIVLRAPRSYLDLADPIGVSYRTPARRGGDLLLRSRWADLGDARRPGVRRQSFFTLLRGRGERHWAVGASNHGDRVWVKAYDGAEQVDLTPESASVERRFGPNGTITVTVSTEWLPAERVELVSAAFSRRAVDRSPYSPMLDVGPVR